ncbi:MAG: hypothetical protein ABIP74_01675 [Candidatus Saccharimonas sp.]
MEQQKQITLSDPSPITKEAIMRQKVAAADVAIRQAQEAFSVKEKAIANGELEDDGIRISELNDFEQTMAIAKAKALGELNPMPESRIYKIGQWFSRHFVR